MTLIEIMVVLVIMTMIAGAAAIGVMNSFATARKRETETRARTLQSAATAYLLDGGEGCPDPEALIRANVIDRTTQHTDAWGNAYLIECEETAVHVHSPGPDEALGTDDDIGF